MHVGLAALILCTAFSFSGNELAPPDSSTAGTVKTAASDSTKPILLQPVVVSGRRTSATDPAWIPSSAKYLYSDDGSKLLLADLRISSALPASAALSLYGLPVDQTARDYVWGHRIGGPTTAVFGSRTKVNPDVVRIVLHPFLMSHRYRDTNGSLEWRPEFQSRHLRALSVSSDLVERRATLWIAHGWNAPIPQLQVVTSVRQSDVAPFLKAAVPELNAIPRYLDSQTFASWRMGKNTFEGFFLFGHETGDWRETIDGTETAIVDDTRQNLAIVRYQRSLPADARLTAGVSWEGDQVDSHHRHGDFDQTTRNRSQIVNPRISYSLGHDALTAWVSQFFVESQPGDSVWRNSLDGGVESRTTIGPVTVQPSLAFQRFGRQEGTIVHGVTAKFHPDQFTVTAGYGTYADYFRFRDGKFGNVFDVGAAQRPQSALHYAASIQYEPRRRRLFDLIRVTGVRKDLDVDLGRSRDAIQVLAWDCIVARGGSPSWELAAMSNQVRRADGPVVGMIPFSLRAGWSAHIRRSLNISLEGNYRSGSVAEYRTPGPRYGERFRLHPSYYLNMAVTQGFEIMDRPAYLTVTVFNALAIAGSRAELTVDQYGRRYDAPCWANVRLRYEVW